MSKRYHWLRQSQYLSPLSPACKMCAQGSKMVVLITGLCPAHCFYCPLSKHKKNKDVIYADEWQLKNEAETETLIAEAKAIDATGSGITGGDPLLVPDRTIHYIKLLKKSFGDNFHIHLYTSGLQNTDSIQDMVKAGLDEIRFHPEPKNWGNMEQSPLQTVIKDTIRRQVETAIEIPVIPDKTKEIIELIKWADAQQVKYVNLNELEFSEQNEMPLYHRGFTMKNELSAAVKGSQETAFKVIQEIESYPVSIGVHYCSSSFKDGVQLTNRMKRRAQNIATNNDIITEEGTILKGIIEPSQKQTISSIISTLTSNLNLTVNQYTINKEKTRIELHPNLLEQHALMLNRLHLRCFVIEEYPTADHLEVERTPIE